MLLCVCVAQLWLSGSAVALWLSCGSAAQWLLCGSVLALWLSGSVVALWLSSCSVALWLSCCSLAQNPADCSTAKKVVCQLNKGCGFGCQVHHATYCLLVAYGTGRMLVLQSRGWHYQHAGWQAVYRPVSEHCANDTDIGDARPWGREW